MPRIAAAVSVLVLALLTSATPMAERRAAFTLQNGKDAQALNAKFATLSATTPCQAGESACIQGAFAQCVNGQFVAFPCSGGLTCLALPLVNSAGTSVTCDTEADAEARIAATGATGGITGSSAASAAPPAVVASQAPAPAVVPPAPAAAAAAPPAAAQGSRTHRRPNGHGKRAVFTLQNGLDAQKLNAKFATLTASTPCNPGEVACVGGNFSQCVNGDFISFPCAGGLTCVALPLVNSPGTSITCDTLADAATRIANTGAPGGISG